MYSISSLRTPFGLHPKEQHSVHADFLIFADLMVVVGFITVCTYE